MSYQKQTWTPGEVLKAEKLNNMEKGIAAAHEAAENADGLPAVTTADNGKIAKVVNGTWAAVTVPSAEGAKF